MNSERPSGSRRGLYAMLLLAPILCLLGAAIFLLLAPGPTPVPDAVVVVKPGENLTTVAERLAEARVIRSSFLFSLAAALSGQDHSIRPGVYRFRHPLTPSRVLVKLRHGSDEKALTIPEGFNLTQVATLLADEGFGRKDDFLSLARDPDFLFAAGIPANTVEGYLFPDTYQISRTMRPDKILLVMVRRFHEIVGANMYQRATELGLTMHQVVTLASLIEKETSTATERRLVSAVFHNRLKRGMPLQSDPTVIYATDRADSRITKQDLASENEYNTYTHKGLPPGPIANPGLAAIEAALDPASTDDLYFVSRNDGTHQFSSRLVDHNRAVARYQRKRH